MYSNTKAELKLHRIPFERRQTRQINSKDYEDWDLIIAMDQENLIDIKYVIGNDPRKLMSFTGEKCSVADPWYTRDFAKAYNDIYRGCEGLLKYIKNESWNKE